MTTAIAIQGNAGTLQAELIIPETEIPAGPGDLAILCHPHPLYGGDMDDQVLGILARVLFANGIATIRFNFRGVGGSGGTYSGTGGEVDDLRTVLRWAGETYPDARLILGGYSFGASVTASAATESGATRALLIAPPAGNLAPPDGTIPVDVFAGDQDAFVDITTLEDWGSANLHRIDGADHFFSGYEGALETAIAAVVTGH